MTWIPKLAGGAGGVGERFRRAGMVGVQRAALGRKFLRLEEFLKEKAEAGKPPNS